MIGIAESDAPWLPTLWDIAGLKPDDYWDQFGWEQLECPADCTYVTNRMGVLKTRFEERYADRMLNAETMERWQLRLQNKFDEVVYRYDRAYQAYTCNDEDMFADVKQFVTVKVSASGTGKSIDTPDSVVNADSDYADSLTKNESTTENTTSYTGTGLTKSINDSIDNWRDIDTEFINEFENNFLNIFWC